MKEARVASISNAFDKHIISFKVNTNASNILDGKVVYYEVAKLEIGLNSTQNKFGLVMTEHV